MSQKSWFIKYAPQNVEDLIFDNDDHKKLIKNWLYKSILMVIFYYLDLLV